MSLSLARKLRLTSRVPAIVNMFKFPGHMDDYEVLSRGSAFPIIWHGKLRWITSRHVTHPQLHLDSYYANDDVDWLKDITFDMTRQHLEWRSTDGDTVLRKVSVEDVRGDPDLDIAELIMNLNSEDKSSTQHFFMVEPESMTKIQQDQELAFVGHNLQVNIDQSTGNDLGNMLPNVELGTPSLLSEFRAVCDTGYAIQMGMCGGVCVAQDDKVVGMIEGILPDRNISLGPDDAPQRVADIYPNHAVVMGASAIGKFLDRGE